MNKDELQSLKQQCQALKPVVIIGSQGLTDAVHQEIECAIEAHELIKIRVHTQDRELIKTFTKEICEKHQADLIQSIGHVIVVYRKSEN